MSDEIRPHEESSADVAGAPPQFVAYPRAGEAIVTPPGTADQLLALRWGLLWLPWVCILQMIAAYTVWGLPGDMRMYFIPPEYSSVVVAVLAYFGCSKIAYGMGWRQTSAILLALLLGASTILCMGPFIFAVLLQTALTRVFQYGVPRHAMGTFRRSEVFDRAERIQHGGMEVPIEPPRQ